jgi:CopG family nickel-responsive transcriptional regulator
MGIISVSLTDENLEQLDEIQRTYGLKGRSDAIRHAIRSAENEMKDSSEMIGPVEGVLIIVHDHHGDIWMDQIEHKYERQIKTHLHSHLIDRKCLEVMIMSTDSDIMREMIKEIHSTGKANYVRFVRG